MNNLTEAVQAAEALRPYAHDRLLEAAELAGSIVQLIATDDAVAEQVRGAVREAAERLGCDFVMGASPAADQLLRGMNNGHRTAERTLLVELVRVTGATIHQGLNELRDMDVVPAVVVDLRPPRASDAGGMVLINVDELIGR